MIFDAPVLVLVSFTFTVSRYTSKWPHFSANPGIPKYSLRFVALPVLKMSDLGV
jgi:hypothetical protein